MDIFLMLLWNSIPTLCLYILWRGRWFNALMIAAILFIVSLQLLEYRSERVKAAQYSLIETQNGLIETLRYWAPTIEEVD